jgi:hypothetical protein
MGRTSGFLAAAVITLGSACAHGRGAAGPPPPVPEGAPVQVYVTNNYSLPMEIFAVGDATTYDMGVAAPGLVRHFVLRSSLLASGGHVTFIAQSTAYGPRVVSDELYLVPGNVVDFEIATLLDGSKATVRP